MSKLRELDVQPPRMFAIGDIHGCNNELNVLLEYLEFVEKLTGDDLIVFIGDYIDRGADSRGVLDTLLALKRSHENAIFLRGNHEDMLLDYLGFEGSMGEAYLVNGGVEFLSSYGISVSATREQVIDKLPRDHLSFFLNLESYVICGDYVFAHAGLDPLRDLRSQMDKDIFWIRDAFIANIHRFDKTVIFGHTPYQDVMFNLPYKIGIDTGLVYGNKLTCVELTTKTIWQVDYGETSVSKRGFPRSLAGG